MAHGDAREGKWRWNWRVEWVASTLHTTSEHDVSSIITADAHTSSASRRLNWRPRRFKWTRPFRRKTKSGFCACALAFQLASTTFRRNLSSPPPWLITWKWKYQALTGAVPLWGTNDYHEPEAEAAGFSETLIPTELHVTSQWNIDP